VIVVSNLVSVFVLKSESSSPSFHMSATLHPHSAL